MLLGTLGNDTLVRRGNDLLIGGAGADTYSFGALFGNDVIATFTAGNGLTHDFISFSKPVANSFAGVQSHMTQSGTSAVISFDANDTVTLLNVSTSSLTANDFKFV